MATIASDQHFHITTSDLEKLQELSNLLHLFNHRNKNQHRRSTWYRHFSTFRRHLNRLIKEISTLNSTPTKNLAKAQKKKNDPALISRTKRRLEFWCDLMFTKWQHAFSQVVADARFSVLGLVLIGTLAEVGKITGVVRELEEIGDEEARKMLEEFGKEWNGGMQLAREPEDDLGEVVVRRDADQVIEGAGEGVEVLEMGGGDMEAMTEGKVEAKGGKKRSAAEITNAKPKKKRKKAGNAIDDIFG